MTEFKTEIEKIFKDYEDEISYHTRIDITNEFIQLFNKHIEDKEWNIAENLSSQIDPIDTGQTLNKTAQDIINILKIKE